MTAHENKGFSVAFTDGDLERLKDEIKARDGSLPTQFEALLARLKIAEYIADIHGGHDEDCDEINCSGPCGCGYDEAVKTWIQSGKSFKI